uniref:Uncharacterized protein n=1 Tax=Callorhinchus milii TaxID=7868 RepID=A0A4W3GZU8_CALMI
MGLTWKSSFQTVGTHMMAKRFPSVLYNSNMCVFSQNNDRILLLHKTFQHLNKIFHKNMKSVTWDLTQVNHFRELLVTQRDVVKDCIQDSASDSMLSALSTIHTYFRKLKKFLKQYSACAWEVIRMETRARLQQILILTARMTKGN